MPRPTPPTAEELAGPDGRLKRIAFLKTALDDDLDEYGVYDCLEDMLKAARECLDSIYSLAVGDVENC